MSSDRPTASETRELGLTLGLLAVEYDHIVSELGRAPTRTELTVFAGMWSEHCSYKSTLKWLRGLPKEGERILAGPGAHAGVVAIDDTWAVAFKVESHNHPSAVEPYQGAATGVGGILRDIIAQGARPCAVMDSLCFGLPGSARQKHLVDGIVEGIAGYGNAFGVPNVGGRTFYDPRYDGNPLVNALAAGILRRSDMRSAAGARVGDGVLYVGASTGRDGILGAAFASEELAEDTVSSRPHVQVGDPFTGKKLMEACIAFTPELGNIAGQDMGASGITCAAFEIAAAGDVGIEIDLETIPLREAGMAPQEIMLSESQERFIFIVAPQQEEAAVAHFESYGVHAVICGRVVAGDRTKVIFAGETVVDLPAALVADGTPETDWPVADVLPEVPPYSDFHADENLGTSLLALLRDPCIGSKHSIYSHYDQTVGNRTVRAPDQAQAAVQKLPDSRRGFALTIESRGDLCAVDPFGGTQAALAAACRKLACVGAEMVAISDGINVASPRDPVENLKLRQVIRGLDAGLRTLGVPVTGGNCSLYNETQDQSGQRPIPPTPMIGALGLIEDVGRVPGYRLVPGDRLFLLGELGNQAAVSRYGYLRTGELGGEPPRVDLDAEKRLAGLLISEVRAGHITAAKAVDAGGFGVALAKLCLHADVGLRATVTACAGRVDWQLFGEHPATAVVAMTSEDAERFAAAATQAQVAAHPLGEVGGERLEIDCAGSDSGPDGDTTLVSLSLAELREAFMGGGASA